MKTSISFTAEFAKFNKGDASEGFVGSFGNGKAEWRMRATALKYPSTLPNPDDLMLTIWKHFTDSM